MLKLCECKAGRNLEKSQNPKTCLSCVIYTAVVSAYFLIFNTLTLKHTHIGEGNTASPVHGQER